MTFGLAYRYFDTGLVWNLGHINVFLELWTQLSLDNLGTRRLAIEVEGTQDTALFILHQPKNIWRKSDWGLSNLAFLWFLRRNSATKWWKHKLYCLKKYVTNLNEICVHFYAFGDEKFVSALSLIDFWDQLAFIALYASWSYLTSSMMMSTTICCFAASWEWLPVHCPLKKQKVMLVRNEILW